MNGSIMGMTRHEISHKLDEIVDFAGIERYLDTPVKRFSSGMTVRLGFAVAAFLEPEILVVDEVLAVGDVEFQKKAIGKMKDVSSSGSRTVLFVSHNMDSMLSLCNKGILLENGMKKFEGTISDTIAEYLTDGKKNTEFIQKESKFPVFISHCVFNGNTTQQNGVFNFDDNISLDIELSKTVGFELDPKTVVSFGVRTTKDTKVCTNEILLSSMLKKDKVCYRISYPNSLFAPGNYYFRIDVHIPNVVLLDGQSVCHFTVLDKGSEFIKYGDVDNGFIILRPEINELT